MKTEYPLWVFTLLGSLGSRENRANFVQRKKRTVKTSNHKKYTDQQTLFGTLLTKTLQTANSKKLLTHSSAWIRDMDSKELLGREMTV